MRQFVLLADRHTDRQKREDRRSGEVVAMLFNVHRDQKKSPDGITWQDVYPEHQEKPVPQSDDDMLQAMKLWALATAHLKKQPS